MGNDWVGVIWGRNDGVGHPRFSLLVLPTCPGFSLFISGLVFFIWAVLPLPITKVLSRSYAIFCFEIQLFLSLYGGRAVMFLLFVLT